MLLDVKAYVSDKARALACDYTTIPDIHRLLSPRGNISKQPQSYQQERDEDG